MKILCNLILRTCRSLRTREKATTTTSTTTSITNPKTQTIDLSALRFCPLEVLRTSSSRGLGLPTISIFPSQWRYEFGGVNLALLCQYAFGGSNLALLMKSHMPVMVVFGGGNLALWKPTSGAIVVWVRGTASWTQQCLTLGCQHQDTD